MQKSLNLLSGVLKIEGFRGLLFLFCVLNLTFFSVIFLGDTLTSLQIPGVLGGGPYGYTDTFTWRGLLDPGGSTWGPLPQTALAAQQIGQGIIPLWNPYMGLGQPLGAAIDSMALSPLRILLHLNPSPWMWDHFLLFRLILAGWFAFLYLRAIEVSLKSSYFGALIFMLSGYLIFSIDMHHMDAEIFLPFILLCYEKIINNNNKTSWCLLGILGVFFVIIGGQPQSAVLIFGIGFAYYYFRIFINKENRTFRKFSHFSIIYLVVHVAGFAVSSPILIPFLEFYQLSFNNHDVRPGHVLGLGYDPYFSDIVSFIIPYFFGAMHSSWLEGFNWHILHRGYFGVTAVIFALVAFMAALKNKHPTRGITYFFVISLFLMIAKLYGFFWINWVGFLPVAEMVNFGKYMGPIMALCISILAAIGLDRLVSIENAFRIFCYSALSTLFVVLASYFYYLRYLTGNSGLNDHSYFGKNGLPEIFFNLLGSTGAIYLVTLVVAVAIFFGLLLYFVVIKLKNKKFLNYENIKVLVLLIAFIEMFIYVPNPGIFKDRNERTNIFNKAPYIDFLQKNLKNQRVIGVDRVLYPDFASAYQISDLRLLTSLLPKRYMEYLGGSFELPAPPDRFTGDRGIDFLNKDSLKALNLLGVKYVISHNEIYENLLIEKINKEGRVLQTPVGGRQSQWVNVGHLNINGKNKKILFAHAPSRVEYKIKLNEPKTLIFSTGLVPGSWGKDKGDGVVFEVDVRVDQNRQVLFSEFLNPSALVDQRRWHDHSLDLKNFVGKEIVIGFSTKPGLGGNQNNAFDWSAWGEIQLVNNNSPKMRLVYDEEVKIYENEKALPRAFVVHRYKKIKNKKSIIEGLKASDISDGKMVILEKSLSKDQTAKLSGSRANKSIVNIENYSSQFVDIKVDMKKAGILVLSDLYYPGWEVYVNGKKDTLLRANYIMRGVYLKEGKNIVKFVYQPRSFNIGMWIASIAIGFILLFLIIKKIVSPAHMPKQRLA